MEKITKKNIQLKIVKKNYIHVFISPKIALSKKFKTNVLNSFQFIDCLCLLAINKIYFVKKWDKNFWPLYVEIEKV